MNTRADKSQENQIKAVASESPAKEGRSNSTFQFVDNRPEAIAQRKLQEIADNSPQGKKADQLQAMIDNSPRMISQNQSINQYATWHVAQQKQDRAKPSFQMKRPNIDNDTGSEEKAGEMGLKASRSMNPQGTYTKQKISDSSRMPIQRVVYPDMTTMWAALEPTRTEAQIKAITDADTALSQAYADVEAHLPNMDFVYVNGKQPEADLNPLVPGGGVYYINYGLRMEQQRNEYRDVTRYIGAILHEMMHIATAIQYNTNVAIGAGHGANMNLPAPVGVVSPRDREFGLTENQFNDPNLGAIGQANIMFDNWETLHTEAALDQNNGDLTVAQENTINERIGYAKQMPAMLTHYETVLFDLLYYLRDEGAQASRSYNYAHRMLTEANNRRRTAIGPVQTIPRAPLPIPALPQQTFWEWLLSTLGTIQMKRAGDSNDIGLGKEADVMGDNQLEAKSQVSLQRSIDMGNQNRAYDKRNVVQLGAKGSKVEERYYTINEPSSYSYKWKNNFELEVFTEYEDESIGFARFTIEETQLGEPPEAGEQYTLAHVLNREAGRVAHLTKIWNNSLTREGPNHIYRGFAVPLMRQVEERAREMGARLIYLEPSISPCRKDPNTNEMVDVDPTGFYLKQGYSYDEIAVAHNNNFVDTQFSDLDEETRASMKKRINAAALGGVLKKALY